MHGNELSLIWAKASPPHSNYLRRASDKAAVGTIFNFFSYDAVWADALQSPGSHGRGFTQIGYNNKDDIVYKKRSNKKNKKCVKIKGEKERIVIYSPDSKPINICWIRTGSQPYWHIMYSIVLQTVFHE